jgi:L-amino acid N-acyltransferase YncA
MKTDALTIRPATEADIPDIAAIYARAVETTTGNFELTAPDAAEMTRRMQALRAEGAPWLAAEVDGRFAGYAYAGRYRPRPAYRFAWEDSIYLADGFRGRGVGSALLAALIDAAEAAGGRQMIAVIGDSASNPASVALHARFGFETVGRLPGVGWKAGGWRDTLLMQRALGAGEAEPPAN